MAASPPTTPFEVTRALPGGGELTLAGEETGEGTPLVLLHGLSATRRNVVQGSSYLARQGYRLIAYDARGHGESSPAPDPSDYHYEDLVGDLEAVLGHFGLDRPVLAGASMGAATALAWTLRTPGRVAALVQITPAYTGELRAGSVEQHQWERLADALEHGGIDGFVEVAQPDGIPERWRQIAREATRQRMERHRHLDAVAHALRALPRSPPFADLHDLERLEVPTLVVGTRDEADAVHPMAVAREYARRLPHGELVVEDEDESPLAWQGAQLSRAIARFLERAAPDVVPQE